MSLTLIIIVSTVMASLIGLKIYFEYRQENELEKSKQDLENDVHFTQEEVIAAHQPVAVEKSQEAEVKIDAINPTYTNIESINSVVALKENKPKTKKKRYYPSKNKKSQNKKIK